MFGKSIFKNYRGGRQYGLWMMAAVMLAGLYSCKREVMPKRELLSNYEINNFSEAFETFWTGMNSNYLFWDQESVNWDSMYRAYKPRFDSLDKLTFNDTTANQCFQYMADMTKTLKDGQYFLQFWSGGDFRFEDSLYKRYISFAPKMLRAQRTRAELPDTLFDHIIQNNYLYDFDYGVRRDYETNQVFQIISGNITKGGKDILYTSINYFAMKAAYEAPFASYPPRPVIKNFFDKIHKSNCDAVIIDLRNNRGGDLADVDFLVGQFTAKPFLYGYARYKSGGGRLDYTPQLPLVCTPQNGATDFKKPIVILADIYSASLSETVIQAFKALPETKVTVIGEHTYGSSGMLVGNDISTNGGSFIMGNFAMARLSNTALMDKDHNFNFSGISPDIEVKYDASSIEEMLHSGVDIQLEKAIQYLNK